MNTQQIIGQRATYSPVINGLAKEPKSLGVVEKVEAFGEGFLVTCTKNGQKARFSTKPGDTRYTFQAPNCFDRM